MFRIGFGNAEPWSAGMPATIPTYRLTREQVDRDRAAVLDHVSVSAHRTVEYPYVVKIEGEGEYLVRADGTSVLWSEKAGRWEPPVPTDNTGFWGRAFGENF